MALFCLIISAYGNTVLRLNIDNYFTLWRILRIIFFCFTFLKYLDHIIIFIIFITYCFCLSIAYSNDLTYFYQNIVHLIYLALLFKIVFFIKIKNLPDFEKIFLRFLYGVFTFICLYLIFEYITDIHLPNLLDYPDNAPSVRAYFWNENDLAVALVFFACIITYNQNINIFYRILYNCFVMAILYYNSSKIAIISLAFFLILTCIFCFYIKIKKIYAFGFLVFSCLVIPFMISCFWEVQLKFNEEYFSLKDLLGEPIERIINLEPNKEAGSIAERTDSAIYVLTELFKTYGFGLGPGGTWLVLTFPEYELPGTLSTHNAFLQFWADFGYLFLLIYMYLFFYALRTILSRQCYVLNNIRSAAILVFPLIGLSQSGAIITNYTFWSMVYFLILADKEHVQKLFNKGFKL